MIPFHSLFPELAQREVRCVHISNAPEGLDPQGLRPDEYVYVEYYCDELDCDCRSVFLEVIAKDQPGKIFASINYGWEKESFYRKSMPGDPDMVTGMMCGQLDPINEQSEFAPAFLEIFRRVVLDEPYCLRLRRHYQMFRAELRRRGSNRDPEPK